MKLMAVEPYIIEEVTSYRVNGKLHETLQDAKHAAAIELARVNLTQRFSSDTTEDILSEVEFIYRLLKDICE